MQKALKIWKNLQSCSGPSWKRNWYHSICKVTKKTQHAHETPARVVRWGNKKVNWPFKIHFANFGSVQGCRLWRWNRISIEIHEKSPNSRSWGLWHFQKKFNKNRTNYWSRKRYQELSKTNRIRRKVATIIQARTRQELWDRKSIDDQFFKSRARWIKRRNDQQYE